MTLFEGLVGACVVFRRGLERLVSFPKGVAVGSYPMGQSGCNCEMRERAEGLVTECIASSQ